MKNIVDFDRTKHVFVSDAFAEIIKDTIRFFNGTPVLQLPPPENFVGAGVYALYYTGRSKYYKPLYEANRTAYNAPYMLVRPFRRGGGRVVVGMLRTNCIGDFVITPIV